MDDRSGGGASAADPSLEDEQGPARLDLRSKRRAVTREHLVASAREVFESKGYTAATLVDILGVAGVSKATLYAHFTSKTDLVIEVLSQSDAEAKELYGKLDDALIDGRRERFQEWIAGAIQWMYRYSRLLPAWEQALATDRAFRMSREGSLDRLLTWVPRYLESCRPERRAEAGLRVQLLSTLLGAYCQRMARRRMTDEARAFLVQELTELWFEPLMRATGR